MEERQKDRLPNLEDFSSLGMTESHRQDREMLRNKVFVDNKEDIEYLQPYPLHFQLNQQRADKVQKGEQGYFYQKNT